MNAPEISVLMGVYYRRSDVSLLERSVQSVLQQSAADLELLICDDGSSPEAAAYLDKAAGEDPRIRLIREGTIFLLPQKLNACLKEARGKWIARMDDDDLSHGDRFEKQIEYLKTHGDIAFVGSVVNLRQNGSLVGTRAFPEFPAVEDFFFTQPFIHPALMFRRECLLAVGGYSEEKRCVLCEDYDLLLRLYTAGYRGANLQEPLFDYTIPLTAHGNRKMRHRFNEVATRFVRFRELGVLGKALPYVVKPVIVGLIPERILRKLKK